VHNVGRAAIVPDHPFAALGFASFLAKADPCEGVCDKSFLLHLVRSPLVDFAVCARRAADGKYNLQVQQLRQQRVPLPPLPEQRRIAAVLDTVRRAIEATEKVITATQELKRSLMQYLFTYGPVPHDQADRVPLKETGIGPMPEGWDLVHLGSVIASGPQNGIYRHSSSYGSGTPIIRIDAFDEQGQFNSFAFKRLALAPEDVERYRVHAGDILVNRVNSLPQLGKAVLVPEFDEATVFESNMMRFRVDSERALPEYTAAYLVTEPCRGQLLGMARRAVAQSSVNQGDVKSLLSPLPGLPEQRWIAEALKRVSAKAAVEAGRKRALQALFGTMLYHLMTGQVRVNELDLSAKEQT
jgi:type I restriction enzyme S subunit